jgi:hypothetical protein
MAAGSTYTPIATTTLGSAATGITFSSISSAYTDLVLVLNLISTSAANDVRFQLNGDTGTNYSATFLYGDGTSAASRRTSSASFIALNSGSGTTTNPVVYTFQFQNYSNTTTYKTSLVRNSTAGSEAAVIVGLWRSTSAINQIYVFEAGNTSPQTFAAGTTATIYGIAAA